VVAAVARRVVAVRAVRGSVPIGFTIWLLVVVRGRLVRLSMCQPTSLGDDFPVDLLWRHGGASAKVVLVVQDCQALGQRQGVPEVLMDRGSQLTRG
jgi:hypothetical protein